MTPVAEPYVHQEFPKMLYKPAPPEEPEDKKKAEAAPPLTLVVASKEEEDKAAKDGWSEDIPGAKKAEKKPDHAATDPKKGK